MTNITFLHPKILTEAGITLPVKLTKAEALPIIRKVFDAKGLQHQNSTHATAGQYAGSYGPCAIGCLIPEPLGRYIDNGYIVKDAGKIHERRIYALKELEGVFSFENDEERQWFINVQADHDNRRWESLRSLLEG